MQTDQKWDLLQSRLAEMKTAVIAYSGGVDSAVLLRTAADVMGPELIAVTAVSETYPPGELDSAVAFARTLGIHHLIIPGTELEHEEFMRNGPDRCYHCKKDLFGSLRRLAESEGIAFILDGTNADDLHDHRPGRRASEELAVRSPLAEAGLTKDEIRRRAKTLMLPMWDKPSLACLSSRIPYGTRITLDLLRTVQAAEDVVRRAGVRQVRVRHHGDTARIEVAKDEFGPLLSGSEAARIVREVKSLGYLYVCLDLEGYRSGSMNEAIPQKHR